MKTKSTYSTPGSSTRSKAVDSQPGALKVVQVLEAMAKSDEVLAGASAKADDGTEAEQRLHSGAAAVYNREAGAQQQEDELDQLLQLMQQSNEKLQQAKGVPRPLYPERRLVPSVLGLTAEGAEEKLSHADLQVGTISQDYHPNVSAGHIVTQIPAPGSSAPKMSRVQVIVSKGPPSQQEKSAPVHGQERLVYARIQKTDGSEPPTGGIKLRI